jgi:hypothetical protein
MQCPYRFFEIPVEMKRGGFIEMWVDGDIDEDSYGDPAPENVAVYWPKKGKKVPINKLFKVSKSMLADPRQVEDDFLRAYTGKYLSREDEELAYLERRQEAKWRGYAERY